MEQRPIIFIHIVKGGGVTLQRILTRSVPRGTVLRTKLLKDGALLRFSHLPQKEKDTVQFLWGHIPYGAHVYFSKPATYITMLREPVSRVISFYYAAQEKNALTHKLYEADQLAKNISLEEFVEKDIAMVSNFQTRMIAGEKIVGCARAVPLDSSVLEAAKKNIQNHFSFTGIMEQFDESLLLLKKELGLSRIYYARANENKNRHYQEKRNNIPSRIIEVIKTNNELDIALYHYVKERFEEKKKAYGKTFQDDLVRFRRMNAFYQQAHINKIETAVRKIFHF